MGRLNMHKALGQSQLSKIDTGALEQNDTTRTRPIGRPHTVQHGTPDRTMPQGRKWKTSHLNVHKAPRQSQLSKIDTGTLELNGPT